jgi:hypothetical protein
MYSLGLHDDERVTMLLPSLIVLVAVSMSKADGRAPIYGAQRSLSLRCSFSWHANSVAHASSIERRT